MILVGIIIGRGTLGILLALGLGQLDGNSKTGKSSIFTLKE